MLVFRGHDFSGPNKNPFEGIVQYVQSTGMFLAFEIRYLEIVSANGNTSFRL